MSKQFFTKYNIKQGEIFLSKKEAEKFICSQDLINSGKRLTYKGKPKYDYDRISLYPFKIELDFTVNEWYTEEEKKRMRINVKGKIVSLIGLYSRIEWKSCGEYSSCAVSDFLVGQKICKAQRGHFRSLYYGISDKKLFDFFESRGYKKEFLNPNQPYRVSFTKTVKNESEANRNYDDIYDFDRMYSPTRNGTRKVLFEKQISGLTKF